MNMVLANVHSPTWDLEHGYTEPSCNSPYHLSVSPPLPLPTCASLELADPSGLQPPHLQSDDGTSTCPVE